MTFDPISYVYKPTVARSRSTKSGQKTAKNISTPTTNQRIQQGATMLDAKRPSVAEDGDGNGYDESIAEGGFCLNPFNGS